MLIALSVSLICLILWCCCKHFPNSRRLRYLRRSPSLAANRSYRKPEWVRKEIIRLKAHLPAFGCRKLADMFNRLFAARGMTVSKTFVSDLLRQHHYEIAALRRTWKTRIPPPLIRNLVWGLDLTGKMDRNGEVHAILGIVDHGTRFAVSMEALHDISTIAILRALLAAIERFGKPRVLRTDNGSQFRSLLFRCALFMLGIRQQFSKPGMPWMNGRVEKLFGTFKERLNQLIVSDFSGLQVAISEFHIWYNLLRPHHHLGGRTPFEAWKKIDPFRQPPKETHYVVAWDGLLTGYYLRY
jgi:putative transposase